MQPLMAKNVGIGQMYIPKVVRGPLPIGLKAGRIQDDWAKRHFTSEISSVLSRDCIGPFHVLPP